MGDWNAVFKASVNSGIFQSGEYLVNCKVRKAARDNKLRFARISLKGLGSKEMLLKRLAEGLDFPAYFGGNWDALVEIMQEPSWNPAPGRAILLTGFKSFLYNLPAETQVLKRILEGSTQYWAQTGVSLFVVLAR